MTAGAESHLTLRSKANSSFVDAVTVAARHDGSLLLTMVSRPAAAYHLAPFLTSLGAAAPDMVHHTLVVTLDEQAQAYCHGLHPPHLCVKQHSNASVHSYVGLGLGDDEDYHALGFIKV